MAVNPALKYLQSVRDWKIDDLS